MRTASIYKVGSGFAMTYQHDDGSWDSELHQADGSTIDLRIYKTEENALKMAQKRLGEGVELLGATDPFAGSKFVREWLSGRRPGQWLVRLGAAEDMATARNECDLYTFDSEWDAWELYDHLRLRNTGHPFARKAIYRLAETTWGLYGEQCLCSEEYQRGAFGEE